jgi:hypothetical protein
MNGAPKPIEKVNLIMQEITLVMPDALLPANPEKRALCKFHMLMGRADEMIDSFWMEGCEFPESEDTEQTVLAQFSCKGLSRFKHKCGLTLTQYDENGKVLNKGKIKEN